jgi:hypothetical protein
MNERNTRTRTHTFSYARARAHVCVCMRARAHSRACACAEHQLTRPPGRPHARTHTKARMGLARTACASPDCDLSPWSVR